MNWQEAEREYTDEVTGETNLARMFEDSAERHAGRPAQMFKGGVYDRSLTDSVVPAAPEGEFRAISYDDMRTIVRHLAAGFRDLGVGAGDRVGIFSNTRMEWAQCDFGLLSAGAVVTTVYSGSSSRQVRYLLDDPNASGVVVENADALSHVLEVEEDLDLEFIVSMDRLDGHNERDDILTLADVHDRGAERFDRDEYESWVDSRGLDDLASLIYTSGTTGQPKGVQLTHGNFRANVNQIRKRYGPRPDKGDLPVIDDNTRTVSYLPLAHVFERLAGHFEMFASGACVGYAESPDTLQEDFAAVQPNAATSVPRVYEKIYDAIREQAETSGLRSRIFDWATDVGVEYHETEDPGVALRAKAKLADKLVFQKVREALGGNVDFLISGGGSLSAELCALYHAMGLPIMEGYGLTETAPVVAVNPPEEPKIGTIGPPVVDVDVYIDEEVVEQATFADDPGQVGELLVHGPNVTEGYWEKPGETTQAFTEIDGKQWFRTGDVVHRRPDGYIEFRERSKQILVLSTGKNVAPAPIEDAFAASPVVEQCMVVGDGEKFVGALMVPNLERLRDEAAEDGTDLPDDDEAAVDHEYVQNRVREEVDRINPQFETHEQIKQFRLVTEEFTEENDLLTPTMKKKRRNIIDVHDELIDDIYAE
ncbi:AMP-dependent synthetase/ligase [Haloarchaeobius iranensis]|uniref:Long-chain acyl-CoA synthetase n=1 Tax=Haloarchaeobius iranensis TaxID=996166 RepID=A0A1G9VGN7_9EURY|nr:long-chain fatty acid--CoA ligase [Haloarchaeobius iranensis]SDM71270.1 long-chain acyl-CoA synthetase [Haloarchaeobius iranensis]